MLMEHSLNSSSMEEAASEESGWTSYFEDLSKGLVEQTSYCSSTSLGGSSLVSDAASSAAWKLLHRSQVGSCSSVRVRNSPKPCKKLLSKKTITKKISEDDPLEDTASSPINSPKVSDLNPTEFISKKMDEYEQLDDSRGNGFKSEHYPSFPNTSLQRDDSDLNCNGNNMECTDLKKRGLCLVPFSMLVNYYG